MRLLAIVGLFLCSSAFSFQATAEENARPGWLGKIENFVKADIYRLSWGFGEVILRNPDGFDVPRQTHEDGRPEPGTTTFSIDATGEKQFGWEGRRKRLWNLHFDTNDYNGLELNSFTASYGLALDPKFATGFGGRVAVGLGGGFTHSETFFDSAIHPAIEAWGSIGIQVSRFTLDLNIRERRTLGVTLDERTASPSTQTVMLQLGILI